MRSGLQNTQAFLFPASCAVKPIVPLDQAAWPQQTHCHIPSERRWTAHVIDVAKFEGFPLNSSSSRYAALGVHQESRRNIFSSSEDVGKRARVLDGLSGSLCKKGHHRVSCVTDKRDAPERE